MHVALFLLRPVWDLATVVFGDAATAAAIAGLFSVINTIVTVAIYQRVGTVRREGNATHKSVADLSMTTLAASEAALEACRVAKSIGANLRHEDALVVIPKPEGGGR